MRLSLFAFLALVLPISLAAIIPRFAGLGGINDFSCSSSSHPVPLVLFHGLVGSRFTQLFNLQVYLSLRGYCTFQITYGALPLFPLIGGLKSLDESSDVLAKYVEEVAEKTGSDKVDILGYSEGAFLALYVPKFTAARSLIRKVVSLAPPTHGSTISGFYQISKFLGLSPIINGYLSIIDCQSCIQIEPNSTYVQALNEGPVAQEGITYSIISSNLDELVSPSPATSFVQEDGVRNILIQDHCPLDIVGHLNEAIDTNVWNLIINELEDTPDRKFICAPAYPL